MINKSGFRKASAELGITAAQSDKFYDGMVKLLNEFYKKEPDWKTIMTIEENALWPVLQNLINPSHVIFKRISEIDRNEFINSIKDELEIRSGKTISRDSRDYLIFLLKKRVHFLQEIIEITPSDIKDFTNESAWIKWLIAGGAIVAIGVIGKTIAYTSKNKNEKK